jgi:hypothetical protein
MYSSASEFRFSLWGARHHPVFNKYLLEPIHFTMERKMMLGIRERVEGRPKG